MKEEILSIASDLREGSMSTDEAKEHLLSLFSSAERSEQLPQTFCKLNRDTCGEQSACKYPHCHL